MTATLSRDDILTAATEVAGSQLGGTLATMHAEDGTPYVTFVLFHLRADGKVLFGSGTNPQHTANIRATPEVSFLIDNREAIRTDWTSFDRVVIEGRAEEIAAGHARYESYVAELREKNRMASFFTEHGSLFCIEPRRIIVNHGFEPDRLVVDFSE
ncbi:MAG: pyridoxamine 5'-phosphate oxidase family protein [Dehalococcoidia bacterium]|nr:pyridoxamine 5'-phosphate oxidase family protein [Dehalococcoidia bacterium]